MPTGGKKTTGTAKGSTGAKPKQPATSKPTKTDNTTQNNTSVGSDEDFLFTGQSPEQKEDEWLNKFQHLMKIKKNKVDDRNKFSENLKRLYDALLKELSIRCGVKYESVFDTADDGHSEIEMTMNVTPKVNTKEKDLLDKLAESSAKYQELTEENNKLKDQLKSYQDNLKKFEKQADDYKKENNQLKQNISEMKKNISEIEYQRKLTKPREKTEDALYMLKDDTLNLQKKLSSQQQDLQQMQQKIDALTKKKANEKADFLKQKENHEKGLSSQTQELQQMQQKIDALIKEKADVLKQKENLEKGLKDANTTLNKDNEENKIKLEEGDSKRTALENENSDLKKQLQNLHDKLKGAQSENVTQGKTDSSNKEQITSLTDENKKIKLKHKGLEQQQIKLQQQQRDESQRSVEKINILTAEKESLETVVSRIKKQLEEEKRKINKELSSQTQELQQMQQKIDALTKEKADVLKQKENLEKWLKDANNNITTLNKDNEKNKMKLEEGDSKRTALQNENNDLKKQLQNLHDQLKGATSENVTQGKTDISNKEQITSLTDENKKIKLKHKELEQQQIKLQQQQREESQRSKEKINILTAEKVSLETVVSQIKKQLEEEKRKINKELSKVAGMKLTEGNPAIADLGDPNRPTQLGEKFAEMYDNEWTDAMEELEKAGDEKTNINTLKTIVEKSYEFGKTRAASYVKGLEKAFLDLSNGIEVTDIISKYIKDHRKNTALLVLDGLYKSFVSTHPEYNVGGDGVKNFIKKAVSLCWLMAIQDPPVVLTTKLTGKFDTDHFRHYTKSGSTMDYVVWPVLFLHEGGPIIGKGVAQGK